jgi:hypothetical protein
VVFLIISGKNLSWPLRTKEITNHATATIWAITTATKAGATADNRTKDKATKITNPHVMQLCAGFEIRKAILK